jgi:hypothetical protein
MAAWLILAWDYAIADADVGTDGLPGMKEVSECQLTQEMMPTGMAAAPCITATPSS